jgi:hypothetical protein
MNLPAGVAVKTGLDVASVDFGSLVKELESKKFDGYVCACVKGYNGLEEGTLVYEEGKIVACFYEYYAHSKTLYGTSAFTRIINASAAKFGVVEIYQLSHEQVQLIIAFNEQAVFVPAQMEAKDWKVPEFSSKYEEQVAQEKAREGKESLLEKYKIAGVQSETGGFSSKNADDEIIEELVLK